MSDEHEDIVVEYPPRRLAPGQCARIRVWDRASGGLRTVHEFYKWLSGEMPQLWQRWERERRTLRY